MIDKTGAALSFPFRLDVSGTLAVTNTPEQLAREAIIDIIETQPGDRVMLPEYGVRDYAFATVNAGFARRLAFQLRQQILDYVPQVQSVDVEIEVGEANEVEVSIDYTLSRGTSASFTYPLWQLRQPLQST